jgi:6-phospho-beta-glucosidase
MKRRPVRLAVLGGSSPGAPVLLEALEASRRAGRLDDIEVRLHGRNGQRLERIQRYIELQSGPAIKVLSSTRLEDVVTGATHVLCMLRPGGMEGRAHDEALALSAGTPADEGLGVGGLACFLRGRALMREVAERCAVLAPDALFLQMTSPLGLNVAIARRAFGERALGVCELPMTTSASVSSALASQGFKRDINRRCFGLNHQSWLYAFRDESGADITQEVLQQLDAAALVGVDSDIVRQHGAIPMNYLRLYLHTPRVLAEQRAQKACRGEQLAEWSRRLDDAYCAGPGPHVDAIADLLGSRRMNWFSHGVVPVIEASLAETPRIMPLNVASAGAVEGVATEAIVEVDCLVSRHGIDPIPAPPLPPLPAELTRQLLDFEQATLDLDEHPSAEAVEAVLGLHPLTPADAGASLASALAAIRPERPVLN